jgi:HK97 family phage major capsid protein
MKYLQNLMEEREALAQTIQTYATQAEERGTSLTEQETAEVKRIQGRCAEIDAQLTTFGEAQESSRRYADLAAKIGKPRQEERQQEQAPEVTSLADVFLESRGFQDFLAGARSTGKIEVPGVSPLEMRAPLETGASPGSAFMPAAQKLYAAAPADQRPLTAVVGKIQVSSNVVDWVTYPAAAPLAGKVAEGDPKPEATLSATVTPVSLDTFAHWVQATRQLLEDATAVRSFIEQNLSRGVMDKVEAELAAALIAATIPTATDADLLSAIRVGIGEVENAGFTADAIVLNPADYAALDIQVMGGTLNGPTMRPSYWGLPVVPAGAVSVGTAYVGSFADGMTLLNRTGISLYVSDSHGDTFTSNIFTILAEARAKALVGRPEALVECSVTP